MMKSFFSALLCMFVLFTPVNLYAKSGSSAHASEQKKSALKVKNTKQAAAIIKRLTKGKLLKIKKQNKQGNTVYRAKVLKADGRIVIKQLDARSGRLLGK